MNKQSTDLDGMVDELLKAAIAEPVVLVDQSNSMPKYESPDPATHDDVFDWLPAGVDSLKFLVPSAYFLPRHSIWLPAALFDTLKLAEPLTRCLKCRTGVLPSAGHFVPSSMT